MNAINYTSFIINKVLIHYFMYLLVVLKNRIHLSSLKLSLFSLKIEETLQTN